MPQKKKFDKKDIIIVALKLLERKGTLRNLSFREISRELKCAHTNLYNYYSSFQDLIWDCIIYVLDLMQQYSDKQVQNLDAKDKFYKAFDSMIQFAIDFPSFYSLIWLESMEGNPPVMLKKASENISKRFTDFINIIGSKKEGKQLSMESSELIHSYLHGELVKIVCGRIPSETLDHRKQLIITNIEKLILLEIRDR